MKFLIGHYVYTETEVDIPFEFEKEYLEKNAEYKAMDATEYDRLSELGHWIGNKEWIIEKTIKRGLPYDITYIECLDTDEILVDEDR